MEVIYSGLCFRLVSGDFVSVSSPEEGVMDDISSHGHVENCLVEFNVLAGEFTGHEIIDWN